jgi:hypothetical protein
LPFAIEIHATKETKSISMERDERRQIFGLPSAAARVSKNATENSLP